jgi:hypothetical protein
MVLLAFIKRNAAASTAVSTAAYLQTLTLSYKLGITVEQRVG